MISAEVFNFVWIRIFRQMVSTFKVTYREEIVVIRWEACVFKIFEKNILNNDKF